MARSGRHTVMGPTDPRRAAATRTTRRQARTSPRSSSPPSHSGRRCQPGFRSRRPGVDILVLVAGGRSKARRRQHQSRRADAGGSFLRRMVRVGEARGGAGARMSCRGPGCLRGAGEWQRCRGCCTDRRRRDGISAADCRRWSPDLLRMVRSRQHRPQPGPGACAPFRHGGPTRARPGRRRQRRPLGRVGGGRDQVASGLREGCHQPRRRLGGHSGALRRNDLC